MSLFQILLAQCYICSIGADGVQASRSTCLGFNNPSPCRNCSNRFSRSVAIVRASRLAKLIDAVRKDLVISWRPKKGSRSLGQTFLK